MSYTVWVRIVPVLTGRWEGALKTLSRRAGFSQTGRVSCRAGQEFLQLPICPVTCFGGNDSEPMAHRLGSGLYLFPNPGLLAVCSGPHTSDSLTRNQS